VVGAVWKVRGSDSVTAITHHLPRLSSRPTTATLRVPINFRNKRIGRGVPGNQYNMQVSGFLGSGHFETIIISFQGVFIWMENEHTAVGALHGCLLAFRRREESFRGNFLQ